MIDFANRDLFEPVTHPDSGVTVHVLSRKVAPVQEAFYFVNDSMSADARYLWFYCAFPPSGTAHLGRSLGVLDFRTGETRHCPETQFGGASPWIDPDTGEAYWMHDRFVWRRGPQPDAPVELVNAIPEEVLGNRRISRMATHLTRSVDGRELFVDFGMGLQWIFGSLPLDGKDFQLWHRFDRLYNHAQFSPADPDLVLFAEENHPDPVTGLTFPIRNRMWTLRRGETPQPIFSEPTRVSHEWWDNDGEHVWCVAGHETWRVRISDSAIERLEFPHHCWHSHCSRDARLIVCDSNQGFYRGCASGVYFFNRETGKEVMLVDNPPRPDYAGKHYHIDPHPRFCAGDQYIVFTTTIRGEVDVAMISVRDLIDKTS
ncbi:MAG: hypothetical protein ACOCWJ_04270 [Verrucomicrobiota bacterium]